MYLTLYFFRCFILMLLILLPICEAKATPLMSHQKIDKWLHNLSSDKQAVSRKNIDWGVLPGPFFTPELGLGLGVAFVGLYRPDKQDLESQISTASISGFLSSNGAFGFGLDNYSFFEANRWRLFINGLIENKPTYFWGTGFSSGRNDRGKQAYTSQELSLRPILYYRVATDTYFGAGWSFSSGHAKSIEDKWKGTFSQAEDGPSALSSGATAAFTYDSRDFVPNPSRGQVLTVTYTYFSTALGGDTNFSSVENQYSLYHRLNEKSVLAWDLHGRFTHGDVPWNMLSNLGNSRRMRGYYEGRYRDRDVVDTQLEYRRKLSWRHGVVAWLGTGTMSQHSEDLGKSSWLPSVGVGYRFEFKPRMNVRLDYGVGKSSSGFYFQVGEAF